MLQPAAATVWLVVRCGSRALASSSSRSIAALCTLHTPTSPDSASHHPQQQPTPQAGPRGGQRGRRGCQTHGQVGSEGVMSS